MATNRAWQLGPVTSLLHRMVGLGDKAEIMEFVPAWADYSCLSTNTVVTAAFFAPTFLLAATTGPPPPPPRSPRLPLYDKQQIVGKSVNRTCIFSSDILAIRERMTHICRRRGEIADEIFKSRV